MMAPQPLFEKLDRFLTSGFETLPVLAVGLSGGPDSMALAKLLSLWSEKHDGPVIQALIVDHGLRPESGDEAELTAARIKNWPKMAAHILRCDIHDPQARTMEKARQARYAVFAEFCATHNIQYLCLAHHREDQAETFLFRLAKGSGLDGLAAMSAYQKYSDHLVLVRPLLDVSKQELIALCQGYHIDFINDPSNQREEFARPRLRKSADILAREGLTPKRLAVTAARLERARATLETLAEQSFAKILLEKDTDSIVLNLKEFMQLLDEVALRTILHSIKSLRPDEDYLPRMEKIEDLFTALRGQDSVSGAAKRTLKRTLGGLIFERDEKNNTLVITKEK